MSLEKGEKPMPEGIRTASKGRSAKEGDVVIVHEDGVKRGDWNMGVVDGLIRGRDNEVRGTHVRVTTNGRVVNLTRPVQKLYPIEVHAEPNAGTRADRTRIQTTEEPTTQSCGIGFCLENKVHGESAKQLIMWLVLTQ